MKLSSTSRADSSLLPRRTSRFPWAILALGVVALVFFWQYFLLDQTLYAGDTAFVFSHFITLPQRD